MTPSVWSRTVLVTLVVFAADGCSRAKYRVQADREAYNTIAERNVYPQWCAADYSIEIDPRSRYYDGYNPDRPPLPPDDPASHRYMQLVDGKRGWKHWHDNGDRPELENPAWRAALAEYMAIADDGSVILNVDSALKLAYVNSPSNQTQLETLYLSALDVTAERFRLDTQFFGGYDARYGHNGSLIPPAVRFDPVLGRFVVNPAIDGEGVENNRLTLGRPFGADPALQARRRFATAGDLLVGFANSFVFEFTGSDANLAASLANFSLVQPLLRGAGKDIALEQLTFVERALLANLRAYSQYRQGFYTQVAIGELGVSGPQRGGSSTNIPVFLGQGGVGGYVGLLQQLQQIRNTEDNLSLQLRTLSQLEALLDVGVIDLVQVDQFRQSIENERARLLQNRNSFEFSVDRYKTGTLGLPPDLPVELDDNLIRQFQLVAREATTVQDAISELRDRVGQLPDDASVEAVQQLLTDVFMLVEPAHRQLDEVRADLGRMDAAAPEREQSMTDAELDEFRRDRIQLGATLADLEQRFQEAAVELDELQDAFSAETSSATARRLVVWLSNLLRLVQRSILVQARARLEAVSVDNVELSSQDAFRMALSNRMDFMNGRASLVDSWRLIQVNADALQSVLNVTASGELRTARNNAVSFRGPTGNLRLGLEFDAPLTRLLERNDYRESLINYQRSRRNFIQSCDSLHLGLRALLRDIKQLRESLEIQRRAVAIAIRRVDLTRAELYAPVPPPQPGQRAAQFGPTAAINLLSAQSALRDTQNSFLGVWLNYYAAKMRLARELGTMALDQEGRWIDQTQQSFNSEGPAGGGNWPPEDLPEPPPVPDEWIELVNFVQPRPHGPPVGGPSTPNRRPAPSRRYELSRLPPIGDSEDPNGYGTIPHRR